MPGSIGEVGRDDEECATTTTTTTTTVPHWTQEPDWVDWCDKENPQKSIDEDTQRKHKLGEDFIEVLKERYDGPHTGLGSESNGPAWMLVEKRHLYVRPLNNKAQHLRHPG